MPTSTLAAARIDDWLERLSTPVPEPGGGEAAGVVIATGAALVAMAAGYALPGEQRDAALEVAARARREALIGAEHDGRMSAALVAAFRRPLDDAGRDGAVREATVRAAQSGAALVAIAAGLEGTLAWLEHAGEPRLAPDVAVAARMLACGIRSTAVNIRCNVTSAIEAGADAETAHRLQAALDEAHAAAARLDACAERVTKTL
ncbi:MAG: cyclodeaminase/cyclohydrolase family protein [Microbacterium sp.]|uniref:cyclodeaminase/cyclohydrolase family protein n=1 Tax=Microbacterium sp. TaxID=51671 RepID=UPI001ACCB556|nr:cyclodeaminase/cyclohydrolase family protein [Microbacterium sp.]MBN9175791.1 cyclodeaminase/cyclohydrolase family protein [Microbacterium sp.]